MNWLLRMMTVFSAALTLQSSTACTSAPSSGQRDKPYFAYSLREAFPDPSARELAEAAGDGKIAQIESLIRSGVSVNYLGMRNFTPLYWALRERNLRGFKKLLEMGADPNVLFTGGHSVIHLAVTMDNSEFLRLALKYGGNPNLVDSRAKVTPIFVATSHTVTSDKFGILIAAGADVNFKTFLNETPLHSAASISNYQIVLRLLEHGADWTVVAKSNVSLLRSMKKRPQTPANPQYDWYLKVKAFLEEKGADFTAEAETFPPVKPQVTNVTGYSDTLSRLFPSSDNPHWKERAATNLQLERLLNQKGSDKGNLLAAVQKEPGKYNPIVLITAAIQTEKTGKVHQAFVLWSLGVARGYTDTRILKDSTAMQGFKSFVVNVDFNAKEAFTEKSMGGKEGFQKAGEEVQSILNEQPATYERHWVAGHGVKFDPKAEPSSYMLPESEWKKMDEENLKVLMKSYE